MGIRFELQISLSFILVVAALCSSGDKWSGRDCGIQKPWISRGAKMLITSGNNVYCSMNTFLSPYYESRFFVCDDNGQGISDVLVTCVGLPGGSNAVLFEKGYYIWTQNYKMQTSNVIRGGIQ